METILTIVHVSVAFFMILVVLIQGGNQGGVGAAFGGGNSQGVFGSSGATTLLGKLTYAAAAIFMATSLALTVHQRGDLSFDAKSFEKAAQTQTGPAFGAIPVEKAEAETDASSKGKGK